MGALLSVGANIWAPAGAVGAALISGMVALVTTRITFRQRAAEISLQAQEDYRTQAIKQYRNQVGGPKSQIIESIHDLGDRLYTLLSDRTIETRSWTGHDDYFRRSFVWLLVRPAIWMNVLRLRRTELDETLGDVLLEDFQFQKACRAFESSLTQPSFFSGTDYNDFHDSAHVFAGNLRRISELMIDDRTGLPIRYSDYEDEYCGSSAQHAEVASVLRLVTDLQESDRLSEFKMARLICVYVACMCFLEHWRFPYRQRETPSQAKRYLDVFVKDATTRDLIASNIDSKLLHGMWPEEG